MSAPLLIADSGPLIALARLDLLSLPRRFFAEAMVTTSVWEEVSGKPKGDETDRLRGAVDAGFIRIVADPDTNPADLPQELRGGGIDLGERTVIALARDMGAAVLIDDLRARRAAQRLALPLLGTLGLLARARASKVIGPLRPLLGMLSGTGYFLPASAIEQVLTELGE